MNQQGNPVTVTIPADTVASTISKADANDRAKTQAMEEAQARLVCTDTAPVFVNIEQSYTAECAAGSPDAPPTYNAPVTVTIPAGIYSGTTQASANAAALAAAKREAESQLNCSYWNRERSFTAKCPTGSTGSDVTATIPAGTVSGPTQAVADDLALAMAQQQAVEQLVCSETPKYWWNEAIPKGPILASGQCPPFLWCDPYDKNTVCPPNKGNCEYTVKGMARANTILSTVSQADANTQARNLMMSNAVLYGQNFCLESGGCLPGKSYDYGFGVIYVNI
jgi:hypothetical protein